MKQAVDLKGSLAIPGTDRQSQLITIIRNYVQSKHATEDEKAAYLEKEIRGDLLPILKEDNRSRHWNFAEEELEAAVQAVVDQGAGWPTEPEGRSHYFGMPSATEGDDEFKVESPPPGTAAFVCWGDTRLKAIGTLSSGLRMLDLRHARNLETLPDLPKTLETLDLTGCSALRELPVASRCPQLRYLYLGGCTALKSESLSLFLETVVDWRVLREIELFGLPGLNELRVPRDSGNLRHVDVSGCEELTEVRAVVNAPALEHLNAENCPKLNRLDKLPLVRLQFLGLSGCGALKSYLHHDLNERHRGLEKGENSAGTFRLLTKLDCENSVNFPRCKLIFLGNGGGGKTTLARSLGWDDLSARERSEKREKWDPALKQGMTHGVFLKEWLAQLQIQGEANETTAHIRMWDFGGQEIYHGTHRVFAASSSVFVIVDSGELRTCEESGLDPAVHEEYHRLRPLAYWLDYIRSLGGEDRKNILVVHSRNPRTPDHSEKRKRSTDGLPAYLQSFFRKRVINEYWVGCWDEERPLTQFGEFKTALKQVLTDQVVREGRRLAPLLHSVGQAVEDSRKRSEESSESVKVDHALVAWESWRDDLLALASRLRVEDFQEDDVVAITRMMHRSGDLFLLGEPGEDAKIIRDQVWAIQRIYDLLDHPNNLSEAAKQFRRETRLRFGEFSNTDLYRSIWPGYTDRPQVQALFLNFLEKVGLCAPVSTTTAGRGQWLALDPFLLPRYSDVSQELDLGFHPRDRAQLLEATRFYTFSPDRVLDESQFRKLQGWLARVRPRMVRVWRNGVQYEGWESTPAMAYRLEWRPTIKEGYAGYIAVLLKADPNGVASAEQAMQFALGDAFGPHSPFPVEKGRLFAKEDEATKVLKEDLRAVYQWKSLPPDLPAHIAFSTRRATVRVAELLETKLKERELRAFVYTTDDRCPTRSNVFATLRDAQITVLLIGKDFVQADYTQNRYTLEELWDAVLCWAQRHVNGARQTHKIINESPEKTIGVLYFDGDGFQFHADFEGALNAAHRAFREGVQAERGRLGADADQAKLNQVDEKAEVAGKYLGQFAQFWTDINPPSGHFKFDASQRIVGVEWVEGLRHLVRSDE